MGGGSGRGPRTYLVLAQNNAELRATGGIPTAWATLTVDTGKISMSTFGDPPRNGLFSQDEAASVLTAEERNLFSTKMATDYPDINFTPDFPASLISRVSGIEPVMTMWMASSAWTRCSCSGY